ncbi:hypothetical protein Bhyg_08346 [Pseudolycoriella hygida]|uniref:Uncharacterized protein n=1 Tax=Pseudolycoriella hygida TaxID=35572 RepID=A0A9Q0N4J9_9DIPT|nr:hypothetical protein Bhyg_08346 [Pseudolycoriella hygida]
MTVQKQNLFGIAFWLPIENRIRSSIRQLRKRAVTILILVPKIKKDGRIPSLS